MIRTIFNAFFTEIYSNKKEFVCLKFLESYRNNLFISIILCIYIFIFINFDIFSIPYIYSSIEIFLFIGFWILFAYYCFIPFFTFLIFIDKQNIKIDISDLSDNVKFNHHMFFIIFGGFITILIEFVFVDPLYKDIFIALSIMVITFVFLYFKVSSINYFLFILPCILYFYIVFIILNYNFLYLIVYFIFFCSIFIYNKILLYIIKD